MNNVTDPINAMNSELRQLYSACAHMKEKHIRQNIRTYIGVRLHSLSTQGYPLDEIRLRLAQSFGVAPKSIANPREEGFTLEGSTLDRSDAVKNAVDKKEALGTNCDSHTQTTSDRLHQLPGQSFDEDQQNVVLRSLLYPHEYALDVKAQVEIIEQRLENARCCANNWGYELVDLLCNLNSFFSAHDAAFEEALTHSFWKVIYHLSPRQALKLGVPKPRDLRVDKRWDPERLSRLVDYIRCGRLAKDTAQQFRRELHHRVCGEDEA